MQVSHGDSRHSLQSEINITPLVDVVLVLLIIFMVVVPLMVQGYDVDMPRASAEPGQAMAKESQLILLISPPACNITTPPVGEGLPASCRVSLADKEIAAADLPAKMAEMLGGKPPEKRVLFLAADDRLNYEGVLRIVDLAKSGVDDLKIEFLTSN
jgi:biopolymer transport protein ExbD